MKFKKDEMTRLSPRVVADYLRRPAAAENIALETMLVSVDEKLRAGDHAGAAQALAAVNAALDIYEGQIGR